MKKVDINVDVGEGFEFDDELLQIATSANVCCGAHAGSESLTLETIEKCRSLGVRVGAHPGYPDRTSLGRAPIVIEDEQERVSLLTELMRQVDLGTWDYVKPHGALYNGSFRPGPVTVPLVATVLHIKKPLMGMAGTHHEHIAFAAEVALIKEGFADRAYTPSGLLVPRTEPGAVLSDLQQIADQALVLAQRVDSICVHGDTPGCVGMASLVRSTLEENGFEVGW